MTILCTRARNVKHDLVAQKELQARLLMSLATGNKAMLSVTEIPSPENYKIGSGFHRISTNSTDASYMHMCSAAVTKEIDTIPFVTPIFLPDGKGTTQLMVGKIEHQLREDSSFFMFEGSSEHMSAQLFGHFPLEYNVRDAVIHLLGMTMYPNLGLELFSMEQSWTAIGTTILLSQHAVGAYELAAGKGTIFANETGTHIELIVGEEHYIKPPFLDISGANKLQMAYRDVMHFPNDYVKH